MRRELRLAILEALLQIPALQEEPRQLEGSDP
jgi:hypothetical protein